MKTLYIAVALAAIGIGFSIGVLNTTKHNDPSLPNQPNDQRHASNDIIATGSITTTSEDAISATLALMPVTVTVTSASAKLVTSDTLHTQWFDDQGEPWLLDDAYWLVLVTAENMHVRDVIVFPNGEPVIFEPDPVQAQLIDAAFFVLSAGTMDLNANGAVGAPYQDQAYPLITETNFDALPTYYVGE